MVEVRLTPNESTLHLMKKNLLLTVALTALVLGTSACSGSAGATPTADSITGFELDMAGASERIAAAGLEVLPAEGTVEHYHSHLDILWNGQRVTVPAEIGISLGSDGKANGISALHTHNESGVIHVEAATAGQAYTLGQLFTQWGIMDGRDAVAGSGKGTLDGWKAYVNGASYEGSLTDMRINAHDQITLVFGTEPESIPSSYTFAEGE